MPPTPPVERRKLRSRFTGPALGHWLAAVAARAGVSGVVVADDDGLLVGSAGPGEAWEELAAHAAVGAIDATGHAAIELHGAPATVRAMDFEGNRLRVCALGEPAPARAALAEAVAGIERILRGAAIPEG